MYMYDLKIDTDFMQTTIDEYQNIYEDILALKDCLTKEMENLKSVYWQSEAGNAFFDKYNAGWADNVEVYLNVVLFLKDQLQKAKGSYEGLCIAADKIKIDLD